MTFCVVTDTGASLENSVPEANLPGGLVWDVTTTQIHDRTYAVVSTWSDNGVHIIDITEPANPFPVAGITNGTDGFDTLYRVHSLDIVQISDRVYAVAVSPGSNGVQIIDITEPTNPLSVASVLDRASELDYIEFFLYESFLDFLYMIGMTPGGFDTLSNASDVSITQISGQIYAIVTSGNGGIQIMDITNPADPIPTSSITHAESRVNGLSSIWTVDTTLISGRTYAAVGSFTNNMVQIIDITEPINPILVASITDGVGIDTWDIAITQISGRMYAVKSSGDGVQIIDITEPTNPLPVASITDGVGGFDTLNGVRSIATTQISDRTYAIVVTVNDNGVQIIDITEPTNPLPVAAITDGVGGFDTLKSVRGIATIQISDRTYAVAGGSEGVQIIDITEPTNPLPIAKLR